MPKFDTMQQLEAYLLLKVQKAMSTTVALEVKQLESKNVKEVVYSEYSPKEYLRREDNGGLSDINNMSHDVISGGNMVVLSVDNNTMSNPDYNPYDKPLFELAGLVEYGDGNGYGEYDYYGSPDYLKPRRFIEKTKQDLESGKARYILIQGLIKEGISVI